MSFPFHIIIPARYKSTRLPGKLLLDLQGTTVLERVYQQCQRAQPASITIATDSPLIYKAAQAFGACVEMTSDKHPSGTERIVEVIGRNNYLPDDIIVNVQGDEPLMAPALIIQVAQLLAESKAPMATLCWPIDTLETCSNPHVVKVVRDKENHALYFSRARIPYDRDGAYGLKEVYRHIGIYAYHAQFLMEMMRWPVCPLEAIECVEQLRVLWAGYKIKVDEACVPPLQDINTEEDLHRVREHLMTHSSCIE